MIENFDKIKDLEFNFPINSALHAMYKVVSVSTLNDTDDTWHGVLGCKRVDSNAYIGIPDYIVFTIQPEQPSTYRITCMMNGETDRSDKFEKKMFLTPTMFLQCLTEISKLY